MVEPSKTYSVARIHALETNLMDKMKLDRMLEAESARDVLKILAESGNYGAVASELEGPWDYEKMLYKEQQVLKELLAHISPNRAVTDLFFMDHDVNNVKVMIKSRLLKRDFPEFMSDLGAIDIEVVEKAFKEDDFRELPAYLVDGIREVRNLDAEKMDPQKVDVLLDRAMYAEKLRRAKKEKEKSLVDFFQREIDWINIKSFFRSLKAGLSSNFFASVFIPGGHIKEASFWRGFDDGMESLLDELRGSIYHEQFAQTMAVYRDHGSLSELERDIDNFSLQEMKRLSKHNYDGLEPVLGYILAKQYEAKAVRVIMVGKLNGLPKEVIKERLRDTYV